MKLENIYTDLVIETSGIAHQARAWSNFLSDIVLKSKTNKIELDGWRYPDLYKSFPIDKFYITRTENVGSYDETKSGYDENGDYAIYLMIPGRKGAENVLDHELRHAFDDFNRLSRGKPGLVNSTEAKLLFSGDFENLFLGRIKGDFEPFMSILRALYYTSKIEQNAYTETVFGGNEHIIDRLKEISQKDYRDILKLDPKKLEIRWNNLHYNVHIPIIQKFNNYTDFVNWTSNRIERRSNECLKNC